MKNLGLSVFSSLFISLIFHLAYSVSCILYGWTSTTKYEGSKKLWKKKTGSCNNVFWLAPQKSYVFVTEVETVSTEFYLLFLWDGLYT